MDRQLPIIFLLMTIFLLMIPAPVNTTRVLGNEFSQLSPVEPPQQFKRTPLHLFPRTPAPGPLPRPIALPAPAPVPVGGRGGGGGRGAGGAGSRGRTGGIKISPVEEKVIILVVLGLLAIGLVAVLFIIGKKKLKGRSEARRQALDQQLHNTYPLIRF